MPSRRSYYVSSVPARPTNSSSTNDHQQQEEEDEEYHQQQYRHPQQQQEQQEQQEQRRGQQEQQPRKEDSRGATGATRNKRRRITTSFHSCSSSYSSSSSSGSSSSSSCSCSSFSSGGGDRRSDRRRDDVPSNEHHKDKDGRNDHRTAAVRRTATSCTSTSTISSSIIAAGRQDHQNKQVTCPLGVLELLELQQQERQKGQAAGVQAKQQEETRNRSEEEWPQHQQQKKRMGRRMQQQDEQQQEAYSRRYYYHQHNQHYDQNRNIVVLVDDKNHQIQQHENDEEQDHRYQQQQHYQQQEVQTRLPFPSSLWQKQPLSGVVPRTEYHTSTTTSNASNSNSVRGSYDAFLTKDENIYYPLQHPKLDVMTMDTAMGRNKGDIVYYTVYQPCTFHTALSLLPWKEGGSADVLYTTRNDMEPAIRVLGQEYQQQTEDAKTSRSIGSALKEAPSSAPIAIEPSENDVISGRGNGANRRVGNIRFREIVSEYKNMYNYAKSNMDKKHIAMAVIRDIEMQNPPGRFLQKNEMTQTWQVLERRCVLRKVLQALREPVQDKKHRMMKANSKSLPPPKYSTSPEANNLKIKSQLSLPLKVVQSPERSAGGSYVTVLNRQTKPAAEQCRSNVGSVYNGHTFDEQTDYDSSFDDIMAESADVCPPFLANQANFAFVFNYENMTIKSFIDHATEQDECNNEGSLREDHDMLFHSNNQLLRDISVVASTCRDLTPLYVMVRAGSSAFSTIRSTNNKHLPAGGSSSNQTNTIVPSQNDILVNATEIHNHTGNLRLAECIQYHFHEYMKVQQSGADHGGQQVLLLELLIDDIVKMCTTGDNEGTRSNRFSRFESPTKFYPNGRFLVRRSRGDTEEQNFCSSEYFSSSGISWMLLTKNDVKTMIISLFHQAASFILKPHPNDVLLNRRDVSRLSPGNVYFRSIVLNFKEFYRAPSLPEKEIEMAVEIVGLVISRRSRFLAYVKGMGMWMPLTFQNAVKKTRQLLSFQLENGVPFANL